MNTPLRSIITRLLAIIAGVALLVACDQVLGSDDDDEPSGPTQEDDEPSGPNQLEQLVAADSWVMTEEDIDRLPKIAGLSPTGYAIEVADDGTFEVWLDRGLWERFEYQMINGTTLELTGLQRAYDDDNVTAEFAFSVAGDSLNGTFSGTSDSGPWEVQYDFERGSLTKPLEYREDFDDGTARFAISDEWDIIDDGTNKVYAPETTVDGNADAVFQILAGRDFILTADVKFVPDETNDETPQLFLGFENSSAEGYSGPRGPIFRIENFNRLRATTDEEANEYSDHVVDTLEWDTWYAVEIRATTDDAGMHYQFLLEDEPVATVETDAAFVQGIKLEGSPNSRIWYLDNLAVIYPETPTINADYLAGRDILFHYALDGRRHLVAAEDSGDQMVTIFTQPGMFFTTRPIPGTRRTVTSQSVDDNLDIYTMDPDGTNKTRLTSNANQDYGGVPTPDGATIIFNSDRDGGDQFDLYSVPVAGGEAINLTETTDASETDPEVSPDGERILYGREAHNDPGTHSELWVMDIDGTNHVQLTPTDFRRDETDDGFTEIHRLSWHPDGEKAVFAMDSDEDQSNGGTGLYLVSTAATGAPHTPEELVAPTTSTAFYDPQFSRDGETIFVHDNNTTGLYAVDATTGVVTPLFEPASENDRSTYSVVPYSRAADGTFE